MKKNLGQGNRTKFGDITHFVRRQNVSEISSVKARPSKHKRVQKREPPPKANQDQTLLRNCGSKKKKKLWISNYL